MLLYTSIGVVVAMLCAENNAVLAIGERRPRLVFAALSLGVALCWPVFVVLALFKLLRDYCG